MTQSELEPLKSFRHGEVVLLQFPFTNLAGSRRRPSLVMLDTGGEDIVVARVTSQTERAVFDIRLNDWTAASLLLPFVVRLHKLATIQKSLLTERQGRFPTQIGPGSRGQRKASGPTLPLPPSPYPVSSPVPQVAAMTQ